MADIASGVGKADAPSKSAPIEKEAWNADAGFYLTMAIVSCVVIFLGFAPSFYLKSVIHAPPPLTMLTVTHGLVFTAWIALFITQASLIAANKPAPHRQLGILGALLFGAMVPLALSTAITAGRLGHAPPGSPPPLHFMALPMFAIVTAAALVATALWNRRRSDWHKRLMIASIFIMTGPATGRLSIPLGFAGVNVWIALGGAELLLLVCIGYDYWKRKRVHPAYWVAAGAFLFIHLGVVWAFSSPTWLAFAQFLTQS